MGRVANILVVAGEQLDQQALVNELSEIAGGPGAQVLLLGVSDPPADDPYTKVVLASLYERFQAAQLEALSELRAKLQQAGIAASIQQVTGKPYEEIIRAATANSCDLIMKPAANKEGKSALFFGRTDMQLFRLSPVPVWIFKPTPASKLARVMVAVDLLAFDDEKSALADKIIQWGKYVAKIVGASLHLLHVWDLHQEFRLRGQVGPDSVDSLLRALQQRHRDWLNEAISRNGLDTKSTKVHFRKGDAEEMIPSVAQAQGIDLLILGTVGRTGIPGFFIGNTADSVLRQVSCSVLTVKPDGFRSPVRINR